MLAWNGPLYPVYVMVLTGRDGLPWCLLTMLISPFFYAIPWLSRFSSRGARLALAVHDRAGAAREIDAAIAALSASATAAVVFPPPVAAPAPRQPAEPVVVAVIPPGPPPVTKALLPGRWELQGAKYVWMPPDTDLRQVDERAWQQGRYVWRDRAWVWVPAHNGLE